MLPQSNECLCSKMCSVIVECLDASSYIVHMFFNSDFKLLFVYPIGDIAIFTLNFMYIIVRHKFNSIFICLNKVIKFVNAAKTNGKFERFFY